MDAKSEQAGERRFWTRWTIGAGIVVLLVLVAFVCVQSHDASLVRRVKELTDELDRTEPDWREPQARLAPLPPAQDSMIAIGRVKALLPKGWMRDFDQRTDWDIEATPPPCRFPPRTRKILEEAVKRGPLALREAGALKDFPDGRFPPTLDPNEMFAKVEQVRAVAWFLQCANQTAVENGDIADAWGLCRAQMNVCKPFHEGLFWIGLFRSGFAMQAAIEIQRVLAHGEISDDALEPMRKSLGEQADADLCFPHLRYDRAEAVRTLDRLMENKAEFSEHFRVVLAGKDAGWWARLNQAAPRYFLLESKIETLQRIAELDRQFDRLKTLRGFDRYAAADALRGRFDAGVEPFVWNFEMRRKSFDIERRTHAQLACAEVGLAAERHRLKFGRWPATANELVDKGFLTRVPEDPFDGAPLRMRLAPDGLVVYAVERKGYDGTYYDDFDHIPEYPVGIEFRLWNPERRHQPPLPPKASDFRDDDPKE